MIVLTAAIMDCFHEGHKNLLEEMGKHGRVIVVIHDDLSCYKIKNKVPIQTVEHRRRNILLTGLAEEVWITRNVDPANSFEGVINFYDGDVMFIRGDDNLDFPGKWLLEQYGIPISYVAYTDGVSSSDIRERHSDGS